MQQGASAAWLGDHLEEGATLAGALLDADHYDRFGVAPRAAAAALALGDVDRARHCIARCVLEPIARRLLAIERAIAGDDVAAHVALGDICEEDPELASALFSASAALAGRGPGPVNAPADINQDIGTILLAAGNNQLAMELILHASEDSSRR